MQYQDDFSDNDLLEYLREYKTLPIQNGDSVKIKPEFDEDNTVYIVSDMHDGKCWIGDPRGYGWYILVSKLEKI